MKITKTLFYSYASAYASVIGFLLGVLLFDGIIWITVGTGVLNPLGNRISSGNFSRGDWLVMFTFVLPGILVSKLMVFIVNEYFRPTEEDITQLEMEYLTEALKKSGLTEEEKTKIEVGIAEKKKLLGKR